MNLASISVPDLIGLALGFIFTILVFTYIIGDSPFFRLTMSIFIGVTAGLVTVMVLYNVLWFQMLVPLLRNPAGSLALLVPPLILGLWLLTKAFPRLSRLGNPVMAYLVGAGAATAIGGSVLGTLFPQVGASTGLFDLSTARAAGQNQWASLAGALIILVGTVTTLLYFYFGVRSRPNQPPHRLAWIEDLSRVGMIFIAVTFGSLFAGVYSASLVALVERLQSIVQFVRMLLPVS